MMIALQAKDLGRYLGYRCALPNPARSGVNCWYDAHYAADSSGCWGARIVCTGESFDDADTYITVSVTRFASIAQTLLEFANFFHFVMN